MTTQRGNVWNDTMTPKKKKSEESKVQLMNNTKTMKEKKVSNDRKK